MTGKLGRAVPAASQDSGTANSVRFALSDVLVQQDGQGGKRQGGAFARPAGPSEKTMRDRLNFLFLNLGHFLDHFFILVIATVVLALGPQWGLAYAELKIGSAACRERVCQYG